MAAVHAAASRGNAAPSDDAASSSATSSCIRSRHASATCEQPWPSNTP
uniref:p2C68 n=1 Tax=Arundo donax TaxID=35708 RepID=A0A0A8YKJ7_ARUDO